MADYFKGIIVLATLAVVIMLARNVEHPMISPSDVVCETIIHCTAGNVSFEIGDNVSSPKYSIGFRTGTIIKMNPETESAIIKWEDGETTTEPITDLNKIKLIP